VSRRLGNLPKPDADKKEKGVGKKGFLVEERKWGLKPGGLRRRRLSLSGSDWKYTSRTRSVKNQKEGNIRGGGGCQAAAWEKR